MMSKFRFIFIFVLICFAVVASYSSFRIPPVVSKKQYIKLSQEEQFRQNYSSMAKKERFFIQDCWDAKQINERALISFVVYLSPKERQLVISHVEHGYHPMEAIHEIADHKGNRR